MSRPLLATAGEVIGPYGPGSAGPAAHPIGVVAVPTTGPFFFRRRLPAVDQDRRLALTEERHQALAEFLASQRPEEEANSDRQVDISHTNFLLDFLLLGGPSPSRKPVNRAPEPLRNAAGPP